MSLLDLNWLQSLPSRKTIGRTSAVWRMVVAKLCHDLNSRSIMLYAYFVYKVILIKFFILILILIGLKRYTL